MNTLTSKPDYFFAPLLEFLNVPDNIKLNLERERIRAFEVYSYVFIYYRDSRVIQCMQTTSWIVLIVNSIRMRIIIMFLIERVLEPS